MAEYLVTDTELTAVANAIRAKTGTTDTMTLAEMPGKIESIETGGGGGDTDALINGSITEITSNAETVRNYMFYGCKALTSASFPLATSIKDYAFNDCSALTSVNFPLVTSIDSSAFNNCSKLTSANFPLVTIIRRYAFMYCLALASADFPLATSIWDNVFYGCSAIASVNFPLVTSIKGNAFYGCSALTALILRNAEAVCTLSATSALTNTPIASGTGYIYVPSALLDTYKAATNWTTYADQFRALESYTVDGTTTGALDESKI